MIWMRTRIEQDSIPLYVIPCFSCTSGARIDWWQTVILWLLLWAGHWPVLMPQQEPYMHLVDRPGVSVSGAGHPVAKIPL